MNTNLTTNKTHIKRIIVLSIFITLAAQINIDVFTSYFHVSMGIILFPVFIFLFQKIPLIPITILSGIGVFLSRILVSGLSYGFSIDIFSNCFPELIFYLIYGFASYFYYKANNYKLQGRFHFVVLFFIDYIANFFELIFRIHIEAITLHMQSSILIVALIRTLILWAVIAGLGHYKFILLNQEHAERYQRLILLISKLSGEVIWMKKNTTLIEKTMALSYKLFSEMQNQNIDPVLSQTALTIAKDIHEVKKEYMLILRGISEALDLNLQDGEMPLSDIITVLQNSLTAAALENGKQLTFSAQYASNIFTDKHYFLLSIFRNLFTNALEANEDGKIHLTFTQTEDETNYYFAINDNGPGISAENINQIFTPGFSTKINFTTGEINRGLGLNLVKDMIENQFSGNIRVESVPKNTTFYICIPKAQLEVS